MLKKTVAFLMLTSFMIHFTFCDTTVSKATTVMKNTAANVSSQAQSILELTKLNRWYVALPAAATVIGAILLYEYNDSFRNVIDALFKRTSKPKPMIFPANPVKPAPQAIEVPAKPVKPVPQPKPSPKNKPKAATPKKTKRTTVPESPSPQALEE